MFRRFYRLIKNFFLWLIDILVDVFTFISVIVFVTVLGIISGFIYVRHALNDLLKAFGNE